MKHAVLEQMELSDAARATLNAFLDAVKHHDLMGIKHDIKRLEEDDENGGVHMHFIGEGEHAESIGYIDLEIDAAGNSFVWCGLKDQSLGGGWESYIILSEDDYLAFDELIDELVTGRKRNSHPSGKRPLQHSR
jgi:hypothetical protein